ncbi:DUF5681 domain-containing protein [Methylobacterium sp. J-048]|uniref:DUF5681 domain-containing protein n=1 Tax=Methylobacterium sp. J-048 TaxID=2836635 RepID=UPI001FB8C7DF|nr:DUF5681 domain-containing protein [Methylobacterium sp. J-048]MCJ2057175.1 DUF5681 domain-containing protein [Methylobacterium sp. J-048]
MPRKTKPTGDYEVGYGRPPAHTRFKPGQSGNPRGRAKGARDVKTVIEEAMKREFSQTVTVVEGGKSRTLTKLDLIVITNVNKAAKGEARSLRELLALAHRLGLLEGPPPTAEALEAATPFSAEDQAIVARFLARERASAPAVNANPAPGLDLTPHCISDQEDHAA